jgi:hypothetical protein
MEGKDLEEAIDRLEFTKFSLVNAAISLIPIFPTWTLFPGILIGSFIGDLMGNCESGYEIILWSSIFIAIASFLFYAVRVDTIIAEKNRKQLRMHFRVFSLGIYTLFNTAILLLFIGTKLACYGDGQTILACIYSGPLSSIGIIIMGFILDLKSRF